MVLHPTLESIYNYCDNHTSPAISLLNDLERETFITCQQPHMISGFLQGRFLSFVSKMQQPKCILEIGTYTGYSALCLAEGLTPNGVLHTIEIDEEKKEIIEKYFAQSEYQSQMHLHIGNALEIIGNLMIEPDLILIDADKINYVNYYNSCKKILAPKGIIIVDNTLFHGQVLLPNKSKNAQAVSDFNTFVMQDATMEQVLLPIRDGITCIRKIC
jgi:caffeoyl-CoA O-methyltransferase